MESWKCLFCVGDINFWGNYDYLICVYFFIKENKMSECSCRFFFYLFIFIFVFITTNSVWSYSIIKSGSMPNKMDSSLRRLILFLFENIFSILFYIIFVNFKVLEVILERVFHIFIVKGKYPIFFYKTVTDIPFFL
jgi:hypothetical protein